MTALLSACLELQSFLQARQWQFCFIGGIALQRWGQPRVTVDADVSLLTEFGKEAEFINALIGRFRPRIPEAGAFALANRVLLLQSDAGIPFDISLAGFPFEEQVIKRATDHEFLPGVILHTCSAEDLIVMKAFADRPRDWADIESVIGRQQHALDQGYMLQQLAPLCELKETPEVLQNLNRLFKRASHRPQN